MRIYVIAALLLLSLGVAGCASQPDVDPADPTGPGGVPTVPGGPGDTFGIPDQDAAALEELMVPGPGHDPILSNMILYFDFDEDTIKPEFQAMLRAHAEFLLGNPLRRVRLEGHTDERGSREYNISLGERRALSVRNHLLLLGVPASQITVVSYGEELPAAFGSTEQAWAQNRRVELVYRP